MSKISDGPKRVSELISSLWKHNPWDLAEWPPSNESSFDWDLRKDTMNRADHYDYWQWRLILFQNELLHFVRSLDDFFTTRAFISVSLAFDKQITNERDLDGLIKIHDQMLKSISDILMLTKVVSYSDTRINLWKKRF